ncbi:HYR domain-containing protein [uncultured Aquimarina sp.]|uniref:HYR domain-containing protein n=1 Tax=uncultured Aquimarina sp. TaxID=575652 RepID=UPI0026110604|nr:HYR domain-containing protein [uncultured Aquimarina sp.]
MKKLVLLFFILFSFYTPLRAQCGPGEDTEAPVFAGLGDGTLNNPFRNLLSSTVASVPSGRYYFKFNGSTFQAELDNDTDGGGWLMILNYVHVAGDNPPLQVRNTDLPLLGSSTLGDNEAATANWGHMGNQLAADLDFEEMRFYGVTTGHNRVIDFKTNYTPAVTYAKTGSGSFSGMENGGYTELSGHTANLPGDGFRVFADQGNNALTSFPFFVTGSAHWGLGIGNRWEVDDQAGNTQSTIHRMWVRGDLSPIGRTTYTTRLNLTGNVTIAPEDIGLSFTDNCGNVTLSLSKTDFNCADIGDHLVQLVATDTAGNMSSIDVTIIIEDTPPVITTDTSIDVIVGAVTGTASITLADLNASAADDCGLQSFTMSQSDFSCANGITSSTILTATDNAGNTSTTTVTVNLIDQTLPVVQCVAPFTLELNDTGSVSLTADDILQEASDNCEINSLSVSKRFFDCSDIGDHTVTLTVTDAAGNQASCSTIVTVTIPYCPGDITLTSEANRCGVVYNYPCASNITAGPASGTILDVGSITRYTYDSLDNDGNTVSCSYDVTVIDETSPLFATQDYNVTLGANGTATVAANDLIGVNPFATNYTVDTSGTINREDISATGTEVILNDDDVSSALPIGFTFAFYGNQYTELYLSSNGFITFSDENESSNRAQLIPDTSKPNNLIAFDWNDINPSVRGTIRYTTIGTAPNRTLIVDFDNVAYFASSLNTTVQVKLFETSNRIEIHATNIEDVGKDKTMGLENINGTSAIAVSGRNRTRWSANNEVVAFLPTSEVFDNCGVDTLEASQTTFDCTNIGDNTITLTATDTNGNQTQKTVTVTITDPGGHCSIKIAPKVYLQGAAVNSTITSDGLMRDDLRSAGVLPLTSPYTDALSTDASVFDVATVNDAIVDWIWVELRDATDASIIIEGISALLQRDGDIVAVDGTSTVSFAQPEGLYFIAIQHRNHLGILSANTMNLTTSTSNIDFTANPLNILGGTNAVIDIGGGILTIPSGDFDENGQIQNSDINMVIQSLGGSGYNNADCDMNGQIQNTDINNLMNPNLGKGEQ